MDDFTHSTPFYGDSKLADPFSHYYGINSNQQNFTNLSTGASHFATFTVGNISHNIFKNMDALYCAIKYRDLVKTEARRALIETKKPFATNVRLKKKRKKKPQIHMSTCMLIRV